MESNLSEKTAVRTGPDRAGRDGGSGPRGSGVHRSMGRRGENAELVMTNLDQTEAVSSDSLECKSRRPIRINNSSIPRSGFLNKDFRITFREHFECYTKHRSKGAELENEKSFSK